MPLDFPIFAAGSMKSEEMLFTVLVQLLVIMTAARVFGSLFRALRQPMVVGEIAAGLILGPSCFGHFFPETSAAIFDPSVSDVFGVLSQLGLILLLFVVGLEFDFSHLKLHGRAAVAISLTGILLPFALGATLGLAMHPHLEPTASGEPASLAGFLLFMGVAMSITAIPILGRLMMELNITRTRIGAITISAAAVDDAFGWILLATISSVVQAKFHIWVTLTMVAQTIGFFLFVLLVLRPLLKRLVRGALERGEGDMGMNSLAVIYGTLFLCALVTSKIGIFAIFGAFLLGTVLSDEPQFRDVMIRHLRNFLTVIFLPIFFTYTGLRTDLGTLHSPLQWLLFLAVLGCAVAGKLGGCGLAAWWSGFSARESLCIGTMMNTRALMELIVINVGRDLGVLPDSVFCMLVLMALATTIMTTPMLLRFMRGTELEPFINVSGFLGPGRIPG
jgi:Kef-type K+ transport system membrane component KefB